MTDANTAAINAHLRQQDAITEGEAHLERLQQELAIDLYEAYMTGNHAVIDEVDDSLTDTDTTDNLITKMREAMTKECERPVMGRGPILVGAYNKVIEAVCADIAGRCATPDEFDEFRRDFGI